MDIHKLKLDLESNIDVKNFPASIDLGIEPARRRFTAVIYYLNAIEDLYKAIPYCDSLKLPEDNRVVLVFTKGKNSSLNRNTLMAPFMAGKFPKYKLKAPMMCALSEELTACVFRRLDETESQDETDTFDE